MNSIVSDIIDIFTKKFTKKNTKLGGMLDIYQLTSEILAIEGIDSIQTYRSDTNTFTNGISVLIWNTLYPDQDKKIYSQNANFEYFQYIMFNDIKNLVSRIEIVDKVGNAKLLEI